MLETISVAALVTSVLILAWQSYLLRKQTEVQTDVAVASAGNDEMALLHSMLNFLVDEPALRTFFYDGTPPPSGMKGEKVATLAEMLADCVEGGCEHAATNRGATTRLSGWPSYGRFLMSNSPVVKALVLAQPEWYPRLAVLAEKELHRLQPK